MLKGINFNSGLNIYGDIVFSDPYGDLTTWKAGFCHIFTAPARKRLLGASGQKFILSGNVDFL